MPKCSKHRFLNNPLKNQVPLLSLILIMDNSKLKLIHLSKTHQVVMVLIRVFLLALKQVHKEEVEEIMGMAELVK